jgi:hypothetical protein
VMSYRKATIRLLAEVLDGYAELGQDRWRGWRRRSNSDHLPEQFASVLEVVIAFADPVLAGMVTGKTWNPSGGAWA